MAREVYNLERVNMVSIDYERYNYDCYNFYEAYKDTDFNLLDKERIPFIKEQSINLQYYINGRLRTLDPSRYTPGLYKLEIHRQYLNRIKSCSRDYGVVNKAEELALLVFALDPNFDAYIIHKTSNTKDEIEKKLKDKFGFIDLNFNVIETSIYNKMSVRERHKIKLKIEEKEFN